MPTDIKFEGKIYRVPDDATPDEIDGIISGKPAAGPSPDTRTAGQVFHDQFSNVEEGFGVKNLLDHPVDTIKGAVSQAASSPVQTGWDALKGLVKAPFAAIPAAIQSGGNAIANAAGLVEAYGGPKSPFEAQTDAQNTEAAKGAGQYAAAVPLIEGGVAAGKAGFNSLRNTSMSTITRAPELNKWMNVTPKAMEHGANPAEQILGDKLLATTKEATQANVKGALKQAGSEMDTALAQADHLNASSGGKLSLDAEPIIDKALNAVRKKIGNPKDPAFQANLAAIKSDIVSNHPNVTALAPSESQALIQHLGDSINWHSTVENPLNDAMIDIYRDLRKAQVGTQVPQLEPILSKWQNLYVGDKALTGSLLKDQAGIGTGRNLLANKAKSALKKAAIVGGTGFGIKKGLDLID